jgi:hypothetical protein
MNDRIATIFAAGLWLGYTLGPVFGLYAAVMNSSFVNALLSLLVPFYGLLYFFLS